MLNEYRTFQIVSDDTLYTGAVVEMWPVEVDASALEKAATRDPAHFVDVIEEEMQRLTGLSALPVTRVLILKSSRE